MPDPRPNPSLDAASLSALARLMSAVGQPVEMALLVRAGLDHPAVAGESTQAQLERVASLGYEFGLRTSLASAPLDDAIAVMRGGQPLATTDALGRRWFVLREGTRGRISVTAVSAATTPARADDPAAERDGGEAPAADRPDAPQHDAAPGPASGAASGAALVTEESYEVDAAELAALLGADEGADVTWLVAHSSTPNEAAVSLSTPGGAGLAPVARLVRLIAPERADILAVVAFAVAVGVLMLGTPIAVQAIVNSVALGGTLQPLIAVAIFLFLALGFAAALTAIQTWIVELIQRRIFVRAVADLAARLPRVTLDAYDQGFGPERVNRFFDVLTIKKAAARLLIDALGIVLAVIVGLSVLAFYHPFLLAFDIALLVAIAAIVLAPRKRGEATALNESTAKYEVAGWLEEISRCPEAFRLSGSQQWIFERADELTRDWVAARATHFRTLFSQVIGALALQAVASTALLAIGGILVIQGKLTLGQLVAAELIVSAVVASVAKIGKHLETWYDLVAAVAKVGYLLDLPVESSSGEHPAETAEPTGARLEFRGLKWKNRISRSELRGFDLDVAPGERVIVSGLDGTARLALVDLVWRLRSPDGGVILLDGRDVRDLSPEFLRREIAVVAATDVIQGTIRDNVRMRRPFVSNNDVREALTLVGLDETLSRFPDGLESMMHPHARLLSDDDRRRLMLARALAGQPRVLIVDASGSTGGAKFRSALDAVVRGREGMTMLLLSSEQTGRGNCHRLIDLGEPQLATSTSGGGL